MEGDQLEWVALHRSSADIIDATAALLERQWPTAGGVAGRKRQLLRSCDAFPSNFACCLNKVVVGHVCLKAASEAVDGRGAIAYSVLTASSVRRRGVGRFLMARAEAEAAARGFTFLYLFTPDMREFYEACGYEVCERIAALGAVSRHVDAAALRGLHEAVARRALRVATGSGSGGGSGSGRESSGNKNEGGERNDGSTNEGEGA